MTCRGVLYLSAALLASASGFALAQPWSPDMHSARIAWHAAANGMDIFRVFDSLNYLPNLRVAMEAVNATHGVCEAALCYTGDILDDRRDKFSLKYYVRVAKELERMGAHFLAIKDMAGLCRPYAAHKLVKTLKEESSFDQESLSKL